MPTHVMKICAKLHSYSSTEYGDKGKGKGKRGFV